MLAPVKLPVRPEGHTSELQSPCKLVCRLLVETASLALASAGVRLRPGSGIAAWFSVVVWLSGADSVAVSGTPSPVMVAVWLTGALVFFFFNDTATTEIYTLSLHDALPISVGV